MEKIPNIKAGDFVTVYTKIKEGDKERITQFQGVVIQIKGSNVGKTFTVRKISAGIGIERIFPLHSPTITKIEIRKKGKVRRAKLSYLKQRKGRKMKIKEATQKSQILEEVVEKPPEHEEITAEEQKTEKPEEQTGEGAPGKKTVEKT